MTKKVLLTVFLILIFVLIVIGGGYLYFVKGLRVVVSSGQISQQNSSSTVCHATTPAIATDSNTKTFVLSSPPVVTVEYRDVAGDYQAVIKKDGKEVATVDLADESFMRVSTSSGDWVPFSLYKQTANYAYFRYNPNGVGDITGMATFIFKLERLDLLTNKINTLSLKGYGTDIVTLKNNHQASFNDISDQEDKLAWSVASYNEQKTTKSSVIVQDLVKNTVTEISLPTTYGVYGNIKFSPDSTKLALAGIDIGNGYMHGAVYTINLAKNNELKELVKYDKINCVFNVNGWYSNSSVNYSSWPCD
jgi:hypothetical protein